MRNSNIWFMEKSHEGYWVIHGIIGTRFYLYYTKKEARAKYNAEVKEKRIVKNGIVFYLR